MISDTIDNGNDVVVRAARGYVMTVGPFENNLVVFV